MNEIKAFFQEKWKYFLGCYLWGYLASLASFVGKGVPNPSYYIPIKVIAFFFAWVVGNGLYENREDMKNRKIDMLKTMYNGIKYSISGFVLLIPIWLTIFIICYVLGIDSTPFLNM